MIYSVSITKKGQMTLPKDIRDRLGIKLPGRVTIKLGPKDQLGIGRQVEIKDIKKIVGKPAGRDYLTEREKIIFPQALARYNAKSRRR